MFMLGRKSRRENAFCTHLIYIYFSETFLTWIRTIDRPLSTRNLSISNFNVTDCTLILYNVIYIECRVGFILIPLTERRQLASCCKFTTISRTGNVYQLHAMKNQYTFTIDSKVISIAAKVHKHLFLNIVFVN